MSKITRRACYVATAVALVFLATPASAIPITYTEIATGSGSLNGVAFSNAVITLTGAGDTTGVFSQIGQLGNPVSLTIDISGVGTAIYNNVLNPVPFAFLNPATNAVGFGVGNLPILGTVSSAFATYDLASAIGPITGVGLLADAPFSPPTLPTDRGSFVLSSINNSTATFSASVNAVPGPLSALVFPA